jgi:hypothetical protein
LISFAIVQQRIEEARQDNDNARDLRLPLPLLLVVVVWTFQHYLEQQHHLNNLPLQITTTTVLQTD